MIHRKKFFDFWETMDHFYNDQKRDDQHQSILVESQIKILELCDLGFVLELDFNLDEWRLRRLQI